MFKLYKGKNITQCIRLENVADFKNHIAQYKLKYIGELTEEQVVNREYVRG